MFKFGNRSFINLQTCNPKLQRLFNEVIKHFDCSVLCGYRNQEKQNQLYKEGKTKLQYPNSKHNLLPSMAVDVVPYPISWQDINRFYYFAGFVKGISNKLGIKIRWGGDWDCDTKIKDQSFNDLPHFELIE